MSSPAAGSFQPASRSNQPRPEIVTEPDPERLAQTVAAALIVRLAEAQSVYGAASLVLTGGGIGTATLAQVAALTTLDGTRLVDWSAVDVWWSDERFVPAADPRRNEAGAREALLDRVGVPDERIHPMPASDGPFQEPEDAARWYADRLREAAPPGSALPPFDVLLLGMGPEGHVASIFPGSEAVQDQHTVVAVRNCPKPPPTRLSMSLSAINTAEQVWLLVTGTAKARAVAAALTGADPLIIPAAGVHGAQATRWWLDVAAARQAGTGSDVSP